MKLKIFIPDFTGEINTKICVPILYPFVSNELSFKERLENYGEWFSNIEIVDTIENSDIAMPGCYVNYYYNTHNLNKLLEINKIACRAFKLTVCFTNGDWGITPPLKNFHLYRSGGYLSKNPGNQFCSPFTIAVDPLYKYYNGILPIHNNKPVTPVIGFCGRASKNLLSVVTDTAKNLGRCGLKLINKWHEDLEIFQASSFKRFRMLREIERSDRVKTNFILHNYFHGGAKSFADKENQRRIFYQNMNESHYIFCYRGWGNFSIRLYETMASGRIPILVTSNNNLPFISKINWNMFPVIADSNSKNVAEFVFEFHKKLSNDEFIVLQLKAREIWEEYFTYKSFMQKWVNNYMLNKMSSELKRRGSY
jgi:hypothetical protein